MTDRPDVRAEIMLEIRLKREEEEQTAREAYEGIYRDVALWQSDSFYDWIYEQLQLEPGLRYLDVSCGRGELVQRAEQQGVSARGLDFSHQALRLGREQLGASELVTGDAMQLPFPAETFDVISNIGSLEHYTDMPQAVREMQRVLRPGGRAIVLLPNTFSLMQNIWIALRQGRTAFDPYQPIQRYGARCEWQELLEANGLSVEETRKYERVRPRSWSDLWALLRHPKELVRVLSAPFIPLNLAFCFVFICTTGRS